MIIKIAAAAYPIEWHDNWQSYEAKISRWVKEAANNGAELLVFPEYGAMELGSLFDSAVRNDLATELNTFQPYIERINALHESLAKTYQVNILAASLPIKQADKFVNRAYLFGVNGEIGYQDKAVMTRFEREDWGISSGAELKVFTLTNRAGQSLKLGIIICYDSEFPLLARNLVEKGAELLLAPSCTSSLAGFHRVRTGAKARALENQCYVIHAPTVGSVDWSQTVDENVGSASVYSPSDIGFPADGIVGETPLNSAQWLFAELDINKIRAVRKNGEVLNYTHWDEQLNFLK